MSLALRRMWQPGPPTAERIMAAPAVPAGAVPIAATLPSGGRLGSFAYVVPALSPDGSQAAFYSGTMRPPGESRLEAGRLVAGDNPVLMTFEGVLQAA